MNSQILNLSDTVYYPVQNDLNNEKNNLINKKNYTLKNLQKNAKEAFKIFNLHWGYFKTSVKLTSSTISVIIHSGKWIESHKNIQIELNKISIELKKISSYLKLFSILNIPSTLVSIPAKFKKCEQTIKLKDHEGTVLSGISCSLALGDLFKSVTSGVNTLALTVLKIPVKCLPTIGPLSPIMEGASGATKCYSLFHVLKFKLTFEKNLFRKISNKSSSEAFQVIIKSFLDKHLGSANHSKKINATVLKRNSNETTVVKLNEISAILQQNETLTEEQTENIVSTIRQIKKNLNEELLFKSGAVLTSVISGVALAIIYIPVLPIVPPALALTGTIIHLLLKIYQDKSQKRGLKT